MITTYPLVESGKWEISMSFLRNNFNLMNTKLPVKYKLYCEVIVSRLFADVLNPANRGPSFEWSNFPEMAKRWSEDSLFLHFTNFESKKTQVGEYAHYIASQLIERSNMDPVHSTLEI